ncbi:sigma-54-dependent transcriptional regulator [Desulforhopalus singaporensis]|uniref:DNA-binding transcriptional response regulator, NtrC family, contains REC, AAA-type ATPase, and a Fis-type DNA-binding domains n=1 Tax=Desulforhopalus singaporensis TaxID=91360 RepID=A0A1H0L3U6_9BACT|nr:sigma-54 dependent transcriptional regulator [Desulforhopalus singaporensis]SDO62888.1 DNA-binding transcriptional response regulator, NtrC family, contains REC, AAA-type ATPase, and a Fis-type DNA-binding domains [Desulforhopalus singaporensis]
MSNLLLVEDEARMREVIKMLLSDLDLNIYEACDGEQAIDLFDNETVSLVITDLKLPKISGIEVLKHIKDAKPEVPVIVITAFGSIDSAVEAIHQGAFDYVTKPFTEDKLRSCIKKAMQISRLTSEVKYLRREIEGKFTFDNIIGNSNEICEILRLAGEVSLTDTTVLITGESGTGKELLSRATHLNSSRSKRPFLPVNCAAIPATLLEAELFGYEKGAFTGAHQLKKGKFELASGGTLFLDEIGDMDMEMQAKFLRVLESKTIERLGGSKTIATDVRLIAATNKDLEQMVREGTFREDLYYRISVFPIRIPSLRERRDDIPLLCQYFINEFSVTFGRRAPAMSDKVMEMLYNHPWKGNVRELRNVLERAMILAKGDNITARHVILNESYAKPLGELNLDQIVELLLRDHRVGLEELEKKYIQYAMEIAGNNVSKAARLLGLSRATLRYRLDKM